MKPSLPQMSRQHFEQDNRSIQTVEHFAFHREHVFSRPSLNILQHSLAVHSLDIFWPQTAHNSRQISEEFASFVKKKSDKRANFAAGHVITHSEETRTNTR
jgi:hypothetical protein